MPRYDFECPRCGEIREHTLKAPDDMTAWPMCECLRADQMVTLMRRLPAAPNFTIKGYAAKNGYAK